VLPIAGVALALSVFGLERGFDTLGIAVAYKAKMLCSGVFVAGRSPEDVLAELEFDDLAPLRFIRAAVDPGESLAKASALGIVRRQAASRGATGCALVPRGMTRSEFGHASTLAPLPVSEQPPTLPVAAPDDPIRLALDSVLDRAFSEPDSTRLRRTQAVVVMHRGYIVAERYARGINQQTRLLGWSMTKSVMNALIGILVRDGRLSLDSPAALPAWRQPGDPRGAITLDHLLHMSSGLRFDEGMASTRSDVIRMLLQSDDMAGFAADRALEASPGSRWQYASGTSVLIASIIRNVLNDDRAYARFPREALFDRVGMSSAVIETDAAGTFVGSSLMYATARDWARFGLLYLNDGVWNGERVLPEGWDDYTRRPAPADLNRGYGAHFWLGTPAEPGEFVGRLPEGALQAAGHEGQFLTVLPSHDAVVVRMGRTRFPDAWDQAAFLEAVLAVLPRRDHPRPVAGNAARN
jgi:CubicO group peptidase (beta-lactamase class C family)